MEKQRKIAIISKDNSIQFAPFFKNIKEQKTIENVDLSYFHNEDDYLALAKNINKVVEFDAFININILDNFPNWLKMFEAENPLELKVCGNKKYIKLSNVEHLSEEFVYAKIESFIEYLKK